jgi:hypothetical protein
VHQWEHSLKRPLFASFSRTRITGQFESGFGTLLFPKRLCRGKSQKTAAASAPNWLAVLTCMKFDKWEANDSNAEEMSPLCSKARADQRCVIRIRIPSQRRAAASSGMLGANAGTGT